MANSRLEKINGLDDGFRVERETLIREVTKDITIEVGDSKQSDFKPQFKISRWNNGANFSIRAEEHPDATVDVEDNVVKYKTSDYEVHQYEKQHVAEDGGFEFEWVLHRVPLSNVLTATIQSKNLCFHFQSEISDNEAEQNREGASDTRTLIEIKRSIRPENVVGSYAVYHKTNKNGEYKAGKAFHIYRPEAVDADGKKTWCELSISEQVGVLQVIVPQEYLDTATYPVRVDPTFGYTSIGATSVNTSGYTRYLKVSPATGGILSGVSVYVRWNFAGNNSGTKIGWYSDASGDPSSKLEQSSDTFTAENTAAWVSGELSSTFTAGDYWLALANGSGQIRFYYDTGGVSETDSTFTDLPTTASPTSTDTNRNWSLYATYSNPDAFDIQLRDNGSGSFDVALSTPASTAVNDTRSGEITGQATANENRASEVQGQDTSADNRPAEIQGSGSVNENRDSEVAGADTANSIRDAEVHGAQNANDPRPALIDGVTGANDTRSAETHGADTVNNDRASEVHGSNSANESRASLVDGVAGSTDTRPAEVAGVDTSNTIRSAEVAGSQSDYSVRYAETSGTATDNSNRLAEVHGTSDDLSTRPVEITGTETAQDARSAEITGIAQDSATRGSETHGTANSSESRGALIEGSFLQQDADTRGGEIAGSVTDNASRGATIHGKGFYPYTEKPTPLTQKNSPYTAKTSPLTRKTSPYTTKGQVYTPYPPED